MGRFRKKSTILPKFKGYFHRDNPLFKAIINTAALGLVAMSPHGDYRITSFLARLLGEKIGQENHWGEEDIRKSLYTLQRTKFIKYKVLGDTVKLELTPKGKKRFDLYKFGDMKILEPKNWDKKWRVVVFDIPETRKVGREALREKLKKLGFFRIQKSVWAHPFHCKEEIQFLCEFFEVGNYVLYFETTIENDYHLRKYFSLGI